MDDAACMITCVASAAEVSGSGSPCGSQAPGCVLITGTSVKIAHSFSANPGRVGESESANTARASPALSPAAASPSAVARHPSVNFVLRLPTWICGYHSQLAPDASGFNTRDRLFGERHSPPAASSPNNAKSNAHKRRDGGDAVSSFRLFGVCPGC
ncbi:hypothetical protein Trco_008051 [Trichoderma cornu-damae]|uniref:Uncharacterized protein n=1 Tax=Trichoderma cornu-damae TaxID=654480 RepID=A0A9P8TRA8_9HYPO|nr:hypothetical protein Trco_008051 [Trichoderma cornu-damae]